MTAYYNEIDPYAAQWLRNLIAAGEIAPGDVDERDIREVQADDLARYTQCHFFAGIGGWPLALRIVGWPDDRPVWTGSCPCQDYSVAGKKARQLGQQNLWPYWDRLIGECEPAEIFGEQVDDAIAAGWLDEVFLDLEEKKNACAAAVLPAFSVEAHHERNRIFFYANSERFHLQGGAVEAAKRYGARNQLSGLLLPHTFPALSDSILWASNYGVPNDLGYTKANVGAGNAIVPQVAAEFITAAVGRLA